MISSKSQKAMQRQLIILTAMLVMFILIQDTIFQRPNDGPIPLFTFCADDEASAGFAERFNEQRPYSVAVRTIGLSEASVSHDANTINSVYDALSNIKVVKESGSARVGGHIVYYFSSQDGEIIASFDFQDGMFCDQNLKLYEIEGYQELEAAMKAPEG